MIRAAIDVGSNTVRMLFSDVQNKALLNKKYYRQVTRLAGGFTPESGLNSESKERTLHALEIFADEIRRHQIKHVKAVGTAALRRAHNSTDFIEEILSRAGLRVEVIDGSREAELSCRGILSVLSPLPRMALLCDIGGGSTELILLDRGSILLSSSLPVGVVSLQEGYPDFSARKEAIVTGLKPFFDDPRWLNLRNNGLPIEFIGTAGTITTLAALKLQMNDYDSARVNNLILDQQWLSAQLEELLAFSFEERLALSGMEEGRADLIIPGLQLVIELLHRVGVTSVRVSDAGLLEGILLE